MKHIQTYLITYKIIIDYDFNKLIVLINMHLNMHSNVIAYSLYIYKKLSLVSNSFSSKIILQELEPSSAQPGISSSPLHRCDKFIWTIHRLAKAPLQQFDFNDFINVIIILALPVNFINPINMYYLQLLPCT